MKKYLLFEISFWTIVAGILSCFVSLCLADLRVMLAGLLLILVGIVPVLNKL